MEVSSLTCTPRLPPTSGKAAKDVVRPVADFQPCVWGETFIHSAAPLDQKHRAWMQQRVQKLVEEVKAMLADARGHLEEEMGLVDTLQRLGLAYHFGEEITEALVRIADARVHSDNLHAVSLRFRLLRQEGYTFPLLIVSCILCDHICLLGSRDEFNKFKDADGHFRSDLSSNVKGLLSLYEAAYLGTHADLVLEEAITFCRGQLQPMLDHLQPPLASEVARALETLLIRRMKRLEARQHVSFYEATQGRNDSILELAKLDFNLLQSMHQEEIRDLTLWWKDLGIIKRLNFARDRLVECYTWIIGVYYEPNLQCARKMMTKVIVLLSVLDDIYDSFGTLEELELFTQVIQRWDVSTLEELPEYIKTCFVAWIDTIREFEDELTKEKKSYRVEYLKEQLKLVVSAYLEEAQWSNKRYTPTLEEHLKVSLISSTYQMLTCASFLGMGDIATKDAFDWMMCFPKIVKASTIIGRLMDDIVSHEFEQRRQHVASTVECYMKEYGVSRQKACSKLYEMIEDAWKVINQECLKPTAVPLQLLMSSFNLARMIEVYYKYSDEYTHPSGLIKELISLLLVNCI